MAVIRPRFLLPFLLLGLLASLPVAGQHLLGGKYSRSQLGPLLVPQARWTPFPKPGDRAGWARADQATLQAYVQRAETFLDYDWPAIPATKSLLIVRTGDRDEYQSVSFKKREVLGTLLLAEIHENRGRFIDPIINGVWSICEESFWGVPAHLPRSPEHAGLPDAADPFVDLFVAETGTYPPTGASTWAFSRTASSSAATTTSSSTGV
jgi:hypothetical protein